MDSIKYISTRSSAAPVSGCEAILRGIAPDGGLYVPDKMPHIKDMSESMGFAPCAEGPLAANKRRSEILDKLSGCDYKKVAYETLRLFFTDFSDEEISQCVEAAYDAKFDTEQIAPVVKKGGVFYLELFHGATIAFKDMALSLLPHLITRSAAKLGITDEIVILTATSGDTGKAALAGFADVPGTRIMVFYPKDGVSNIQKLQMITQEGNNVNVVGIDGNFDDAQSAVKAMFTDRELTDELARRGYRFSSANSINIGRLVPQIAYYIWAYTRLVADGVIAAGTIINVTVPTGNFGNILAAQYARMMGLPIKALVCASNENKVLYDFFNTGTYDKNRPFILTTSPSMDILISSNLERLIFEICGRDADRCAAFMNELKEQGRYTIDPAMKLALRQFSCGYASMDDTRMEIKRVYNESGYVLDPHSAVASSVANYFDANSIDFACGATSDFHMLVVSTASPFKFTRTVLSAIAPDLVCDDDFAMAEALSRITGLAVPEAVSRLRSAEIRFGETCGKDEMKERVLKFLL